MRRAGPWLLAALLAALFGCGVRGSPRPPRHDTTPLPSTPCDAGCCPGG